MVVWEAGKMKKSDYRKFIIRGEAMPEGGEKASGILRDDFASMQEAVERRYRRLQLENKPLPSLILIDGGIGGGVESMSRVPMGSDGAMLDGNNEKLMAGDLKTITLWVVAALLDSGESHAA